jgi:superfamily II DNA or RNA helicase
MSLKIGATKTFFALKKRMSEKCRVLTSKGYAIRKDSLSQMERIRIEKELDVAPIVHQNFKAAAGDSLSFKVYRESPERYYLPRQWAMDTFGLPEETIVPVGTPLRENLEFIGKPYEYQREIVSKFIESGGNGLICVPCGRGKTFMAIWTAMRIGKRFLIVVDKEFLLQQWKGELESLVPGIQIGILQEEKVQVGTEILPGKALTVSEMKEKLKEKGLKVGGTKDELISRLETAGIPAASPTTERTYDCTIAMIQTLVKRTFPPDTFRSFGFTIFDECHHLGASHFSKVLIKVQTNSMLGLSATPTRDDGLTKVFEWFLGPPVHWEKTRDPDPTVIVNTIHVKSRNSEYMDVPVDWRGEMVMARLLTNVVECAERTQQIADLIKEACVDSRRRVLVLSERIGHLKAIEELLKSSPGLTMSYYIGGMKEEEREEGARTARILLASYAMASEAMNIKTLNCVVMASPRKKVEQSTGRILRVQASQREIAPLIYDIVDVHDVYRSQYRKRAVYYRKCKYTIHDDSAPGKHEKYNEDAALKHGDACLIADSDSD